VSDVCRVTLSLSVDGCEAADCTALTLMVFKERGGGEYSDNDLPSSCAEFCLTPSAVSV